MEKQEKELVPQDAPLKNTDKAFVQVGHDGEPVLPTERSTGREEPASEKNQQTEQR